MIFLVDDLYWFNPTIAIRSKKGTKDIHVCVDYVSINSIYLHDPFLTLFSDEVLNQFVGKESYYFTDGFLGYHWVQIAEEDKKKTTFTTKCGVGCGA